MTDLALSPARTPTPAAGAAAAAALAARIEVPRRLPVRHDGLPLTHLSYSSYTLFLTCPDAWRRRYLLGEKEPPSGAMFLGSRVDDTLSLYHQQILDRGERLDVEQLKDAYRDLWRAGLEAEEQQLGIDWQDLDPAGAFELGVQALELTFEQLLPKLDAPLAVQRRLEFALAPGLTEWTIVCYPDLETSATGPAGETFDRIVDYKVKGSVIGHQKADRDPQASLYLAGRWLEGRPADEFIFAQIAKPGRQRRQMSAALITTRRTLGQLRSALARIALAASQIDAHYHRFGPDRAWGYSDPTGWKCSERFCNFWHTCLGGAGL